MSHYHNERDAFVEHQNRCTRNMPPQATSRLPDPLVDAFTVTWPTEERIDNIAQNGATGEHYKDELQTMIDSSEAIQETKDRMEAEDNARAKRKEPEVLGTYQRVLTQPIIVDGTGDNLYDVIIDVYDVLDAFDVTNPAAAHAIKKLLCPGGRGFKDWETDLQEAIDSLERAKSFPPTPF